MQRTQQTDATAEILRIDQQFLKRLRYRLEQDVAELRLVVTPDDIEIMWQRKNRVMMRADEKPRLPFIEPLLARQPSTLRTATMAARIVSDLMEVSFRAAIDMATHASCSAIHDLANGVAHRK